ncbi:MAG: hypothetical protein J6R09_05955 [Alistipes sp.]|nr:hypothetical protein [Alistipes sp.]
MKALKFIVAAMSLFVLTACGVQPDYVVEKTGCYAYVMTQDVWGEIVPEDNPVNPYAVDTHKYRRGEWFFYAQLYPEKVDLYYIHSRAYYSVPRGTFRLLTKAEVQKLMQTDKEFAKEAKTWFLLAEDGSPLFENTSKQYVAQRGSMSAFNLFWLFIPALIIAIIGYIANSMAAESADADFTESDKKTMWWLFGSVPVLFIVEALLLLALAYYGVFTYFEIDYVIFFCIPIFAFFGVNAFGAFITNHSILTSYRVSFSWARVAIYLVVSYVVGLVAAMITAFLSGIDNADLWLAIPFLLGLAIALLLTFGVDMCRQNVKSIKALPILAMLFVIGAVMVAFSIVLVVVVVGIWLALRTHVKSEELKDRNNDSLKCTNCIHYGNCPSVGVPCSRHQNWR